MTKARHYIWNRADRVDESLMPHRVIECFEVWKDDLRREWDHLTEKRRSDIRHRIKKQHQNLNESLVKLGYPEHN